MISRFFLQTILGVLTSALILSACESAPSGDALDEPLLRKFERDTLQIATADGERIEFAVYLARTPEQMQQGLMFVRHLDDRTGMLFLYPRKRIGSMWMKNTYISLDILFVNSNGEISDIARAAPPHSLKSIRSSIPVRGAIELNAGSVDKLGIKVGDRVLHSHFLTHE